ncbi:conserved hypothetical protein [Ricinus communis]|uniref:RNA polymerase Rpb4/RPC9 core domain-containing protein n=1 Tax=Ricinus communis TaxID=3988 RepID=B9SGB4_RICCO|nr:conserved hypothetical protein [Ricinus communis]
MEKGGKGFSLPGKGLKSSLKSITPASTKGKDDTSAKSKRGKKVQFNSQGNMSKGGKGDKVSNGVKISSTKEPQPLELKIEQDLPKNAKCLMDCEAAQVLQGIQEQMVLLSRDPTIKLPVSFDRALQHARTGARFTNPQSVRRILEGLKKHGVSEGEICTIANVCPDGVDEVFALVPSLKSKKNVLREPLKDILGQLSELKQQA